jgi:hypothetical protein
MVGAQRWAGKEDTVEEAFLKIDQAAVGLLRALEQYEGELKSCLAAQELASLRAEVTNLRRALLGLEMGVLYHDWEGSAGDVEGKIKSACDEATPHEETAEQTPNPAPLRTSVSLRKKQGTTADQPSPGQGKA